MARRAISIRDFVRDVRMGVSDADLMKKYGFSRKALDTIYENLLKTGKLDPSDLMRDVAESFESTLVVATTCKTCGGLLLADSGECSNCLANRVAELIDAKTKPPTGITLEKQQETENETGTDENAVPGREAWDVAVREEDFSVPETEEYIIPAPEPSNVPSQGPPVCTDSYGREDCRLVQPGLRQFRPAVAAVAVLAALVIPIAVLVHLDVVEIPGFQNSYTELPASREKPRSISPATPHVEKAAPRQIQAEAAESPPGPGKRRDPEPQHTTARTTPGANEVPQPLPGDGRDSVDQDGVSPGERHEGGGSEKPDSSREAESVPSAVVRRPN
ncbi:MAG TPA: hypothetical protein VK463_20755, partial [Desulfomonilaceae bacterium]|nr:hypothetical protein [Desulfomonilaceae bacterium]